VSVRGHVSGPTTACCPCGYSQLKGNGLISYKYVHKVQQYTPVARARLHMSQNIGRGGLSTETICGSLARSFLCSNWFFPHYRSLVSICPCALFLLFFFAGQMFSQTQSWDLFDLLGIYANRLGWETRYVHTYSHSDEMAQKVVYRYLQDLRN